MIHYISNICILFFSSVSKLCSIPSFRIFTKQNEFIIQYLFKNCKYKQAYIHAYVYVHAQGLLLLPPPLKKSTL